MEWFWTIVSYGVILGIGALVNLLLVYWLLIYPRRF